MASSRATHLLLLLVVLAIPAAVSVGLVTGLVDADLLHYGPQRSDEIFNWHQVATFREVGFAGGYYTAHEEPAPLAFSHFYTHGPIYPFLVGSLARGTGWGLLTGPLLNVTLTMLALGLFAWVTKSSRLQLLLLGAVILTFWPMHLYMVSDMRLAFFDVFAILLAACFSRTIAIATPERIPRGLLVAFGSLLALASLSKVTWSFLFLPYLIHLRGGNRAAILQSTAASIVLILCSFLAHNQLTAPYPNFASDLLATFQTSLLDGVAMLWAHAGTGISDFFDTSHNPLWLMLRAQMLGCVLWAGLLVWRAERDGDDFREGVTVVANGGLLIITTIVLYDVFGWRDYRLFAPAMLVTSLICVARRRYIVVGLLVAGNILVLPNFMLAYKLIFAEGRYADDARERAEFTEEIAPFVRYDDHGDGWDNTLLAPLTIAANPLIVGVPAGIGISWFGVAKSMQNVKSRYLLLDPESYQVLRHRTRLEFAKKTSLGALYINRSADAQE